MQEERYNSKILLSDEEKERVEDEDRQDVQEEEELKLMMYRTEY